MLPLEFKPSGTCQSGGNRLGFLGIIFAGLMVTVTVMGYQAGITDHPARLDYDRQFDLMQRWPCAMAYWILVVMLVMAIATRDDR